MKKIKFYLWPLLVLVVLTIIGVAVFYLMQKKTDQDFSNEISWTADISLAAINSERVKNLAETLPGDISQTADYVRIKEQIVGLEKYFTTRGIDSIYLLSQKDGKLYFIAEASLESDPLHVDPGKLYEKAPADAYAAFTSTPPKDIAKYTDEYGTYFSKFVPVVSQNTKQQVAVLGVDVRYDYYKSQVNKNRIFFLIGWSISGLLILFIFLYFRSLIKTKNDNKAKEEKIKAITDSLSDAVIVIDTDLKIAFWNKSSEEVFGVSREKALNSNFLDLVKMENIIDVSSGHEVEMINFNPNEYRESNIFELRLENDQNKNIYYELTIRITEIDKEKYTVAVFHDIAKIKGEEIELRSQKAELEKLNNLMIGREFKMIELKKQLADVKDKTKK